MVTVAKTEKKKYENSSEFLHIISFNVSKTLCREAVVSHVQNITLNISLSTLTDMHFSWFNRNNSLTKKLESCNAVENKIKENEALKTERDGS